MTDILDDARKHLDALDHQTMLNDPALGHQTRGILRRAVEEIERLQSGLRLISHRADATAEDASVRLLQRQISTLGVMAQQLLVAEDATGAVGRFDPND